MSRPRPVEGHPVGGELAVAAGDYSYFDGGGLQSVSYTHQTSPLTSYAWTYDDAGRVTTFAAPEGTVSYSYDNTHQLVSTSFSVTPGYMGPTPGSEAFQYDATGNRTGNGEVVDNNQLLDDSNSEYFYDSEGNTVAQKLKADGSWELSYWDHRYRLYRMDHKAADGTLTQRVDYAYDVYDRRVMKRVDTNPSDGQNVYETTERFVWDGNEVALVLDESGTIEHRFLHGPLIDQVFADETTSDVLWYLTDNQHTVRDVLAIDSTGQPDVINHLTYSAFGQIVGETDPDSGADASALTPFFAYTGREWDESVSLQYNRARWYDPGTGRWYSEDPLRWLAGDTNLYRYVGNNPTNAVDPSGLEKAVVDDDGVVWAYPESWWFGIDYDDSRVRIGQLAKFTAPGETTSVLVIHTEESRKDVDGKEQPVILHFGHFDNFVRSFDFINFTKSHLLDYIKSDGFWVNKSQNQINRASGTDYAGYEDVQLRQYANAYMLYEAIGNFLDDMVDYVGTPALAGSTCGLLSRLTYLRRARATEYLAPGIGSATRGQIFSHGWIKHDLYKQLRGLVGQADFNKFLAALKKGVVGPTGESGIKIFASPVGKYTHELKIGGSAQRLLGLINENGVLVFDKFVRGGLH